MFAKITKADAVAQGVGPALDVDEWVNRRLDDSYCSGGNVNCRDSAVAGIADCLHDSGLRQR